MRKVSDVMSTPTFFVSQTSSLDEVERALEAHRVSALAVIDEDGELVGVVSRSDLIRRALRTETRGTRTLTLPDLQAIEVMTPDPLRVAASDTLAHAAKVMTEAAVHRVFVMEGDDLAGVIATQDVLRAVRIEHLSTPLSAWMSSPPTIERTASAGSAARALAQTRSHGVVVQDAGYPVGVLTATGLLLAAQAPASITIDELMEARPLCLPPGMPLFRAAAFTLANDVRHVLVVDESGLTGMVTGLDFVRAYSQASQPTHERADSVDPV